MTADGPENDTSMSTGTVRRLLAGVAAAGALFLGAACAPSTGTVQDRKFIPAHDDLVTLSYPCGKVTCTTLRKKHRPDEWRLLVVNGNQHGWVSVDRATYNAARIGSRYEFGHIAAAATSRHLIDLIGPADLGL